MKKKKFKSKQFRKFYNDEAKIIETEENRE